MHLFIMEPGQIRIYSLLSLARYAFIIHIAWTGTRTHLFIMEHGLAQIHLLWSRQVPFIYHGAWPGTHSFVIEAGQVPHCPIVPNVARPDTHSFTMEPGQEHIHNHGAWSSMQSFYEKLRPVYKKLIKGPPSL